MSLEKWRQISVTDHRIVYEFSKWKPISVTQLQHSNSTPCLKYSVLVMLNLFRIMYLTFLDSRNKQQGMALSFPSGLNTGSVLSESWSDPAH